MSKAHAAVGTSFRVQPRMNGNEYELLFSTCRAKYHERVETANLGATYERTLGC